MVEAVASGPLSLQDVERYFDAVSVEEAWPYRKLFDATAATSSFNDNDMMILGARIRAYSGLGPLGPLAIAASGDVHQQARLFAVLASADRPLKVFKTIKAARKWLAAAASANAP